MRERKRWEGLTTERSATISTGDDNGGCGEGGASAIEMGVERGLTTTWVGCRSGRGKRVVVWGGEGQTVGPAIRRWCRLCVRGACEGELGARHRLPDRATRARMVGWATRPRWAERRKGGWALFLFSPYFSYFFLNLFYLGFTHERKLKTR